MVTTLLIIFFITIGVVCFLLARKDDRVTELQERVSFLEQNINKKIVSRLLFVELKSVNSVLDTLNNCFYEIDEEGDYIIASEYRLEDVSDEWWDALSAGDLEIVNKMKKMMKPD